jgi:UDP-hydrolysing UDP-N-acetyl-D-glucosamine 2-epimerase
MSKINISAVLVDRANYGRIKPVLEIMHEDPSIKLDIICTGTMPLDRFGRAVDVVRADGFDVSEEIYIELEGSIPSTMAKSIGLGIIEFANVFQRNSPDFVLLIGDRSEALAVAISAVYQNFCLIHLQGGEVTGSIDESARHAITKLAHYHFPATQKSAENIIRMGEDSKCVFPYGCPSADVVFNSVKENDNSILAKGVGPILDLSMDYLVVLFHPVTSEYIKSEAQMMEILEAVREIDMQTVIIWPNIDAGADGVSQAIRRFRELNPEFMLHAFKNFEPEEFIPLLSNASCAIGNSSSFIRDASFLGTPIVLVGSRQDGRERSNSVIRVNPRKDELISSVKFQLNNGKYKNSNLYGDVGVSKRIVKKIKQLKQYSQKKLITLQDH